MPGAHRFALAALAIAALAIGWIAHGQDALVPPSADAVPAEAAAAQAAPAEAAAQPETSTDDAPVQRSVMPRPSAATPTAAAAIAADAHARLAADLRDRNPPAPADVGARVHPDDTVLDLGTVAPGQDVRRTFTIRNEGRGPLAIGRVRAQLGAIGVTFDARIPAGGSGAIEVAIPGAVLRAGRFQQSLEFYSNDPTTPVLLLQAEVRAQPDEPR